MQASALNETRLPRAVREQSDRLKQQYGGRVTGKNESDLPLDAPGAPISADPTPTPAPLAEVDHRESDPAYWKHRFDVTQGVLRKARLDHQEQVAALTLQISNLNEQLQTAQVAATPAPKIDLGEFYTPEQIEELGEEQCLANVEIIKRQVKTHLDAALTKEVKPLKDAQENAQKAVAVARQTAFVDALAELVPDFGEIDESPEWLAWLADRNDDGIVRQKILDEHLASADAVRVANMLKTFLKTQQRPTPPVSPNGTGAAPTQMPTQGDVLSAPTAAEMKAHYKERSLGKLKQEDMDRFDRRLKLLTNR